jgi:hypothetical protein
VAVRPSPQNRLVIGIASPIRSFAAALLAVGAVMQRAAIPTSTGDQEEHYEQLKMLPIGTAVALRDGDRKMKGIYIGSERRGWDNNMKDYIGVRISDKETRWLPPNSALKIKILPNAIVSLPKNRIGRRIIERPGFLAKLLGEVDPCEFALGTRLDCLIIGNINRLRYEIKDTSFAMRHRDKYVKGTLQDVLRVRKFLGSNDNSFRVDVYPATGRKIPNPDKWGVPELVIFDGATGFLKWRDYLRGSNWIVLLDKTEKLYDEAVHTMNQEYIQNSIEKEWFGDISSKPKSIELMIFEEGR